MMGSLRRQAILTGVVIALVSIGFGGLSLYVAFNAMVQRQFDAMLLNRQLQVLAALDHSGEDPAALATYLPDPAYSRPYSGTYWEAVAPDGQLLTSHSLFDGTLDRPATIPGETIFYDLTTPAEQLRVAARTVTLANGQRWQVLVAQSLSDLSAERAGFRRSLFIALGVVGLIGILGALGQTGSLLRQLQRLRAEVLDRWRSEGEIEASRYPVEVRPLVADINELLHRNRDIIDRTRRQGADLAHALKTPCAILQNELDRLREAGADVSVAATALERVDAQLRRSLARVRAIRPAGPMRRETSLDKSLQRLMRLFRSVPAAGAIAFDLQVPPDLAVAMNDQDLEEALGNLIDNAIKWARSRIRVSVRAEGKFAIVEIEDDGPGVAEADLAKVMRAGESLDVSLAGSGLGLTIARDLVEVYGGSLLLSRSDALGGLRATLRVE